MSLLRTRWAAVGAAVAITLGAGGIGLVSATQPNDALTFVPITPCRLFDTRPADQVGPRNTPLGPGDIHTVSATGSNGDCTGIPTTAKAVSMNMTTVRASATTFLTVWAADATQPDASNLNPAPGTAPTPNGVISALSGNGQFKIYNNAGNVHVLADLNGYYVDHNHDDRYYTKDETDASKSMSFDPAGWYVEGGGYDQTGSTHHTGLFLNDGVFASATFDLTLPDDLTVGTELRFDIYWHINQTGCSVALTKNFVQGTRLGSAIISVSSETIPYIIIGPIGMSDVRRFSLKASAPSAGGFRPRDVIKVGIFRGADSCTEPVVIDGAIMTYD